MVFKMKGFPYTGKSPMQKHEEGHVEQISTPEGYMPKGEAKVIADKPEPPTFRVLSRKEQQDAGLRMLGEGETWAVHMSGPDKGKYFITNI
jgi:hypothetical protein